MLVSPSFLFGATLGQILLGSLIPSLDRGVKAVSPKTEWKCRVAGSCDKMGPH